MTPDPSGNFWNGLARVGHIVILSCVFIVPFALLLTFDTGQLIAGACGATIVAIGLAMGVTWGPDNKRGWRR